ncbi:MAG: molybdate transport system ATP-binding protein [Oceanicoccus sp.]|jgi:molybdate transport system ATP-binding protein
MNLHLNIDLRKGDFALKANISIVWQQPSTHVIFGKSGIGKTHLLRSICGLESPQGTITWYHAQHGEHWLDSQQKITTPCHQRHVAMVFQDHQLFRHLNVEQNLRFAFDRSHANQQDWQYCVNALELNDLLHHNVNQLSGGQAQRVALARAILSKPTLLILDEPLASLDWQSKQDVMGYIKRLNHEWQLPVLYVTHDVNEVLTLADHVIMLDQPNGTTIVNEPRALIDILQDDRHPFYGLGKSSILVADTQQALKDGLMHCHIGKQVMRLPVNTTATTNTPLRLCIAASDVSLALSAAQDSSIMNILQGKVSRIEQTENGQYLIQLKIDEQYLLSEISQYSFERLNIQMWQTLYAQIKGVALQQSE